MRLVLLIALIAALAACGGGGEEAEVRDTVRRAVDAYNAKDINAYLGLLTDSAIQDEYGLPRATAAPAIAAFIGEPPVEVRDLSNALVSGSTATVDFEHTEGKRLVLERVTLTKAGEEWKLDGFEALPIAIPSSATTVAVEASEFAFTVDDAGIDDGEVALEIRNVGRQDHQVIVARLDPDASLESLVLAIAAAPPNTTPEGVSEIVAFNTYKPGESGNIVFAEPLQAGRYGLFCFFPDVTDAEMTPHALKGMYAELTVPG
ncbi:MAG TPA: hypothetical protein VGR43_07380 [Dehalococcoidia bacterium]|jgi:uncharacterized cupredoxin-like copper-binding protein|nr:hypothetical protein [Dehalococcoidia bacterium]